MPVKDLEQNLCQIYSFLSKRNLLDIGCTSGLCYFFRLKTINMLSSLPGRMDIISHPSVNFQLRFLGKRNGNVQSV